MNKFVSPISLVLFSFIAMQASFFMAEESLAASSPTSRTPISGNPPPGIPVPVPTEPIQTPTPASFSGYCVSLVGYSTGVTPQESEFTSGNYVTSSWSSLVNDCYQHAQTTLSGSAVSTCNQNNSQERGSVDSNIGCDIFEYLVSGGVAYNVAIYDGSTLSREPVPSSPAPSGTISGLCQLSFSYQTLYSQFPNNVEDGSYFGDLGGGPVKTGTSYHFVTGKNDADLEAACPVGINYVSGLSINGPGKIFVTDNTISFETTILPGNSTYIPWNPQELLTDLNTGTVLVNGPYVPSGVNKTGLCSWSANNTANLFGDYYHFKSQGSLTVWDTSEQPSYQNNKSYPGCANFALTDAGLVGECQTVALAQAGDSTIDGLNKINFSKSPYYTAVASGLEPNTGVFESSIVSSAINQNTGGNLWSSNLNCSNINCQSFELSNFIDVFITTNSCVMPSA